MPEPLLTASGLDSALAHAQAWVPVAACTLPTTEQPLRVEEFDALFSEALATVDRLQTTSAVLTFTDTNCLADRVRSLTARESECCSFFAFDVREADQQVQVVVTVPAAHAKVLTGLLERADSLRARP